MSPGDVRDWTRMRNVLGLTPRHCRVHSDRIVILENGMSMARVEEVHLFNTVRTNDVAAMYIKDGAKQAREGVATL
jgi:hypothetical protein